MVCCKHCQHSTAIHGKCRPQLYANAKQSRATVSVADYPAICRALCIHNAHNMIIYSCCGHLVSTLVVYMPLYWAGVLPGFYFGKKGQGGRGDTSTCVCAWFCVSVYMHTDQKFQRWRGVAAPMMLSLVHEYSCPTRQEEVVWQQAWALVVCWWASSYMVFRTKKVPETKQDRQADRCNILVFVPVSLLLSCSIALFPLLTPLLAPGITVANTPKWG